MRALQEVREVTWACLWFSPLVAELRQRHGESVTHPPIVATPFLVYEYLGAPWQGKLQRCVRGRLFVREAGRWQQVSHEVPTVRHPLGR